MSNYKLSTEAKTRIKTMCETNDGFEIAEADLQLRGPGDMAGTKQSGLLDLKIADIVRDEPILKASRSLAIQIAQEDPTLSHPSNKILKVYLFKTKPQTDLSKIS